MAGQLLGDEVLLGHEKRIFTAECQSDTASLLYISYEVVFISNYSLNSFRDLTEFSQG